MKKIILLFSTLIAIVGTSQTLEGTWKLKPVAGAMGVGQNQGDIGWWSNDLAAVTTRACLFDDKFVFNSNGSFQNVMGTQTWLEGWQGTTDACGTPVAPHNGSNAATYVYNSTTGDLVLTGLGAHIGLAKVTNTGEITSPANAASTITYKVSNLTATDVTVDVSFGGGWWRYQLIKEGVPTCTDGIQNGNETGIDCGGTCPPCITPPMIAAPTPPARPAADVISVFSDAYAAAAVTEWGPSWGPEATPVIDVTIAGNATKRSNMVAGKTFFGIILTDYNDLSTFTHFHMDYWIPSPVLAGQVLSFKLSNHAAQAGETSAIQTLPTPVAGTWQSVDVPLANFVAAAANGITARDFIKEIVVSAARANNNEPLDFYFDNLYFHKNTLSNDSFFKNTLSIFPNPVQDILTINALDTINSVEIFNINGQKMAARLNNNTVDVSNLSSGVYLLNVELSNGSKEVVKFVK